MTDAPLAKANDDIALKTISARDRVDSVLNAKPVVYGITIGDVTLMHEDKLSAEIVEPRTVAGIPNTVSWFAGMINVRGSLLPVFDVSLLLTGQRVHQRKKSRRIIVIGKAENAAGVYLEQLPRRADFDQLVEDQNAHIPEILQSSARRIFRVDGDVWVDLDFQGFFRLLGQAAVESAIENTESRQD